MSWVSQLTIPIFFLLLSSLCGKTAAQKDGSNSMLDAFFENFMTSISQCSCFTDDDLGTVSSLTDTIKAMDKEMKKSERSSRSMMQAINMAFASSLANIAVSDVGASPTQQKASAIQSALTDSLMKTKGFKDEEFSSEVRDLIFIKEKSKKG